MAPILAAIAVIFADIYLAATMDLGSNTVYASFRSLQQTVHPSVVREENTRPFLAEQRYVDTDPMYYDAVFAGEERQVPVPPAPPVASTPVPGPGLATPPPPGPVSSANPFSSAASINSVLQALRPVVAWAATHGHGPSSMISLDSSMVPPFPSAPNGATGVNAMNRPLSAFSPPEARVNSPPEIMSYSPWIGSSRVSGVLFQEPLGNPNKVFPGELASSTKVSPGEITSPGRTIPSGFIVSERGAELSGSGRQSPGELVGLERGSPGGALDPGRESPGEPAGSRRSGPLGKLTVLHCGSRSICDDVPFDKIFTIANAIVALKRQRLYHIRANGVPYNTAPTNVEPALRNISASAKLRGIDYIFQGSTYFKYPAAGAKEGPNVLPRLVEHGFPGVSVPVDGAFQLNNGTIVFVSGEHFSYYQLEAIPPVDTRFSPQVLQKIPGAPSRVDSVFVMKSKAILYRRGILYEMEPGKMRIKRQIPLISGTGDGWLKCPSTLGRNEDCVSGQALFPDGSAHSQNSRRRFRLP